MNRRELLTGTMAAAASVASVVLPLPAIAEPAYVVLPWLPEPKLDDARLVLRDENRFRYYSDGD